MNPVDTIEAEPYLDSVQNEPVLTRQEEVALFKRYEDGDADAFEKIVRANLRFVVKVAYEYAHRGVPLADLIQEGNIGLLEVIPKFDWRKGFRFSTYAAFWIRQAIQTALRQQCGTIRLPIRKSRMLGRIGEYMNEHYLQHGREPTSTEIAEQVGSTADEIERLLQMREGLLSLDAQDDEDSRPLAERVPAEGKSPRDVAAARQASAHVARVLDYLGEREQRVLRIRFGFDHGRTLSLRRTSKIIGLSQEGVRRIERRALNKLRRPVLREMVAELV
jgi:RNA polymerase primary sigma factor